MIAAVMPTYARYDVALERGEGVYAFGTDGRRYLDFGAGIAVTAGAVALERVRVRRAVNAGIAVDGDATRVELRDVNIEEVIADIGVEAAGVGLALFNGARLEAEALRIADCSHFGVGVGGDGSQVLLRDLDVVDIHSGPHDRMWGGGVFANLGARIEIDGVRIARVRFADTSTKRTPCLTNP